MFSRLFSKNHLLAKFNLSGVTNIVDGLLKMDFGNDVGIPSVESHKYATGRNGKQTRLFHASDSSFQSLVPGVLGEPPTDSFGITSDPIYTHVPVVKFNGDGDSIKLIDFVSLVTGHEWTITFKIPGVCTAPAETHNVIGSTGNVKAIGISPSYIGYRGVSSVDVWSGAGNTTRVIPGSLNNAKYILSCDGINIHLVVDGLYYGFITPPDTSIFIEGYGASGDTPEHSYTGMLAEVGVWDTYAGIGYATYPDIKDAIFFHPCQEKSGRWIADISNSNNFAAIESNNDVSTMRTFVDGMTSFPVTGGCNIHDYISGNIIINHDFRFGPAYWLTVGALSSVSYGHATIKSSGEDSYIMQGLDLAMYEIHELRLQGTCNSGSLVWYGMVDEDSNPITIDPGVGSFDITVRGTKSGETAIFILAAIDSADFTITELDLHAVSGEDAVVPAFTSPVRNIRYDQLLTNPYFNTNSDWLMSGDWSIANGKMTMSSGDGYIAQYLPPNTLKNRHVYFMKIVFQGTSGSLALLSEGFGDIVEDLGQSSTGKEVAIVCRDPSAPIVIYGHNWLGSIESVELICIDDIYIPDASGVQVDVVGQPLQHKAHNILNACGVTIRATDDTLKQHKFWSSDGSTFDDKTFSDFFESDRYAGVLINTDEDRVVNAVSIGESSAKSDLHFNTDAYTIMFSAKSSLEQNTKQTLFEKIGVAEPIIEIYIDGANNNKLCFVGSGGVVGITDGPTISQNVEYFITCVYTGSTWLIYLDGVKSSEASGVAGVFNINNGCNIGESSSNITTGQFNGTIGDVRVYNTVLTDVEIEEASRQSMTRKLQIPTTNPSIMSSDYLDSIGFATMDGITSLGTKKIVSTSGVVVGQQMIFDDGSMVWEDVGSIASYIYVMDVGDGLGIKHYAHSNGTDYINGLPTTKDFPVAISRTGISNVTGVMMKVEVFPSESKTQAYFSYDYERESLNW